VCTDSPVFGKTPLHTKQEQFRTYVVAYEVPRGAVPRGLYWDTLERGYHYIRLCDRAEPGSELLIVGGEDHRTGDGDPKAALQRLEEWCSLRFGVSAPIHRWSGQVVEPADHLPFLGRYPGKGGHVYVITGDSGQGFTNHTCGAMLVTDLIQHRRNPYVALYKPSRQGFGAILKRLKGQATAAAAAVKEKAAPDVVVSEGEIPRGSGAIVERGGVKLACYRESTGELRECAAQCTHMGATVRWNDLEKTWDCPWHGSRFSPAGLPLDGPANKPLDAPPREDGPHDHDTEVNPMATTASRRTKRASGRTKSRSKPSRKTHAPAPKRARTGAGRTTRPRNSAARGQGTHDAIAMLKQDHRKVKGLLKKLDEAEEGSRRKSLFQDVEQELLVHARLEEELFYPAFKDAVGDDAEDKKMCFEAHEEHEVAERMAAEIRGHPNPGSDEYAAKCKVLKDLIEHHIKEEEEEMFPVAREEIGREQLLAVAEDMRQRKAEMLQGDVANLRRIAAPQDGIEPDQEPQDAPAAVRGGSRWSRMQRRE
jgi:nitrite reductase/ring-hydroxylating ferredoxin subunit/hemerythrin-like domain-containing protein